MKGLIPHLNGYVADFSIGEILVKVGVVSQQQVDEAVKESGTRQRLIGKTLVARGWLTMEQLRAGLQAQSLLRDGVVDTFIAMKALACACSSDKSFEEALQEVLPSFPQRHSAPTCKLGELLVEAGVLDAVTLESAHAKSLARQEQLGNVLVADGLLTNSYLDAALELQVRVRDGLFTREQVVEALKQDPVRFLAMLAPSTTNPDTVALQLSESIRLGDLLIGASVVNEADVLHALEFSRMHGHPIGEMLLARGFITRSLLDAALSLQQMVSAGQLTIENATACLVQVFHTDRPVSECLLSLNLLGQPAPITSFAPNLAAKIRGRRYGRQKKQQSVKWSSVNFDFLRSEVDQGVAATEPPYAEQSGDKDLIVASPLPEEEQVVDLKSQDAVDDLPLPQGGVVVNYVYVKADRTLLYKTQRAAYSRLGRALLKQQALKSSEELLLQAIEISSQEFLSEKQAEDLMFLACLYLRQGKTWQSERLITLCLESSPHLSEPLLGLCHHRLGLVYCRMGLFAQAEKQFLRACELMLASDENANDQLIQRRLAAIFKDYAVLLNSIKREMEAAKYYAHARDILTNLVATH